MVALGPPSMYITLFFNKINKTQKCLISMFLVSLNGWTRLPVKMKESENERHWDGASQGSFNGSISKSLLGNL